MRNTGAEYGSDERRPVILPELAELLPALTRDQLTALKEDLTRNGCYSPIVVNEDMVIVDGHNRQRLCEELGIPYRMVVFSFEDMLEAKQWALDTQKGRRNLTPWDLGQIALKLKPELEARAKKNMAAGGKLYRPSEAACSAGKQSPGVTETDVGDAAGDSDILTEEGLTNSSNLPSESVEPINTRKEMAKAVGIGQQAMGRIMQIDEHAPPAVKEALDRNELSINQGYNITKQVQDLPEEEREQAAVEAMEEIERKKAEKKLKKRNAELDQHKQISDQFSIAFEKAIQLTVSEENIRIWTDCCRMTRDEMGDMARYAGEIIETFSTIKDIMEQLIRERAP